MVSSQILSQQMIDYDRRYMVSRYVCILFILSAMSLYIHGYKYNHLMFYIQTMALLSFQLKDQKF